MYRALVCSSFKNQMAHEKYKTTKHRNKITHILGESKRNYYQTKGTAIYWTTFIERQFIERQFIETTSYRNNSLSNRQFIEPTVYWTDSLSKRQFTEPTIYRRTVYPTTVYRMAVYRTDSLSNDSLSNDSLSNRQFIETTYLIQLSQDIITAWSSRCGCATFRSSRFGLSRFGRAMKSCKNLICSVLMQTYLNQQKVLFKNTTNMIQDPAVNQHGRPQKFFQERCSVDIWFILFQVANDAVQMDLNKGFTVSTPQSKFPILYGFCWIGVSSSIIITVNCRRLNLNWTWTIHNCICGAHISLCWLNLTSQNLVWNVFYTLAIRNAFSLHKLHNIHFSITF